MLRTLIGWAAVLAVGMATAMASPARAADIVEARIDHLVKALQDAGYQAKPMTPESGSAQRYIRSASDGYSFNLLLMNCDAAIAELNCDSIQFFGWMTKGKTPFKFEAMNDFNKEFRYAKAYIDKDGDAVIEMDINLDKGGMNPEQFADNLNIWVSLYSSFAAAIATKN